MEDPRDPHVELEHPDQAFGHTTESGEVPSDESGVSGVDGEKQEDDKREEEESYESEEEEDE